MPAAAASAVGRGRWRASGPADPFVGGHEGQFVDDGGGDQEAIGGVLVGKAISLLWIAMSRVNTAPLSPTAEQTSTAQRAAGRSSSTRFFSTRIRSSQTLIGESQSSFFGDSRAAATFFESRRGSSAPQIQMCVSRRSVNA